ncbi:MAG: ABC transporter permease [Chloroflexi bacterium]|nr:ABC transporter permease [Chloroflexota bacterium]MBI4507558.1 ABC transporter permease [Chloroflexota bacterium]
MPGLAPVFRKEIADHFSSRRFLILLALIFIAGLAATYVAAQSIRDAVTSSGAQARFIFLLLFTASNGQLPPFVAFISFLGPLLGLALGFDAINSEHSRGTLSRVLAQPVYRDAVINGKFLAGLTTIVVMIVAIGLILSGLGLRLIGIPPTAEEILRLTSFFAVTAVYVAFWMSLAIMFSIFFRQAATSALAGMAVWIVCTFFVGMLSGIMANLLVPLGPDATLADVVRLQDTQQALARLSPVTLYGEATFTLLSPTARTLMPLQLLGLLPEARGMVLTPLPWIMSLQLVWPQIVGLVALTVVCFVISYIRFMRQEIRA